MEKLSWYRKKCIPPFYFFHFGWSYNRNVHLSELKNDDRELKY